MSDLIQRLRDPYIVGCVGVGDLLLEAAKRIAELEAERLRLAGEVANRNRRALDGDAATRALDNVHTYYEKREEELKSALSDATEAQQVLGLKLAQAEAERDALKVDAGRYRFLRDAVEPPHGVSKADVIYLQHLHGAELDAAIDAAKEQQ